MQFLKRLIGAAFVLSMSCGAAQASPVQFNFTGTVSYTDGSLRGVGVGTTFTGSFSYESTAAPSYVFPHVASYTFGPTSQITADIGGHAVAASNLNARVTNDAGSNVEDGVSFSGGYPLSVDGAFYNSGSFGFNLTSSPGNTGVLTSTDLPTSYDVAAFDGHPSLTYGWLQRDGGQTGGMLGFTVNSITASVPEPETYAMMLVGFCLVGLMSRRRRLFN